MEAEIGDVPLVVKAVLWKWDRAILAAGVAVTLPTAKGASLVDATGTELVRLDNNAVHVGPILGLSWQPDDRWFVEGFVQADFDTRGNDAFMEAGTSSTPIGTLYDQNLLFADLSLGHWIYRTPRQPGSRPWPPPWNCTIPWQCRARIPSAGMTTTANTQNIATLGAINNGWDVLDLTAGIHFLLGTKSTLTVGRFSALAERRQPEFRRRVYRAVQPVFLIRNYGLTYWYCCRRPRYSTLVSSSGARLRAFVCHSIAWDDLPSSAKPAASRSNSSCRSFVPARHDPEDLAEIGCRTVVVLR